MADDTLDFGGVTMSIDGDALVAILIPKIAAKLATNVALQTAIVNAIMPQLRAQMATIARSTAGAGTSTPRTGPTPR